MLDEAFGAVWKTNFGRPTPSTRHRLTLDSRSLARRHRRRRKHAGQRRFLRRDALPDLVSIDDNARLQKKLVDRPTAATSRTLLLGGMRAGVRAVFPEAAARVMVVCGAAGCEAYNAVFWRAVCRAGRRWTLEATPAFGTVYAGGVLVTTPTATRSGATAASRASRRRAVVRRFRRGTTPRTYGLWYAPGTPRRRRLPARKYQSARPARAARHGRVLRVPKSGARAKNPGAVAPLASPTATAPATPAARGGVRSVWLRPRCRASARGTGAPRFCA